MTDLIGHNKDGQLEITDKIKFNNWLTKPKLKHKNRLDFYSDCVQQAIEKFTEKDPLTIYYRLKMLYWMQYNSQSEFEEDVKKKINYINNIDELFEEEMVCV